MDIVEELREIRLVLEKIENIVDLRLVGVEKPEEDEIQETEEYLNKKRKGEVELFSL